MSEDRDLLSTNQTSRNAAWTAIIERWPNRLSSAPDYDLVHDLLCRYFIEVFPQVEPPTCRQLVRDTVYRYMANRHATRPTEADGTSAVLKVNAVDLADACRNAILDWLADPHGSDSSSVGPSEQDDEWLAMRAVRAKPDAVRVGLRQLATEQSPDDFLIVTQYLDLADRERNAGPPRSSKVVARLGGVVTELAVREAILAFRDRLSRIGH